MLTDADRPYRGRRITWREFYRLTERKAPEAANDNDKEEERVEANRPLRSLSYA